MVGPYGDWVKYNLDEKVELVTEIDGVRSPHTLTSVLLQKVKLNDGPVTDALGLSSSRRLTCCPQPHRGVQRIYRGTGPQHMKWGVQTRHA